MQAFVVEVDVLLWHVDPALDHVHHLDASRPYWVGPTEGESVDSKEPNCKEDKAMLHRATSTPECVEVGLHNNEGIELHAPN